MSAIESGLSMDQSQDDHGAEQKRAQKRRRSVKFEDSAADNEKTARKRSRFVPMSPEELKSHAGHDSVLEITAAVLKNKGSTLRRFVETVRRDPEQAGAPYLQDGRLQMRMAGSNAVVAVPVYSKSLGSKQRKGRDYSALDGEIEQLVNYFKTAGVDAAYPSFIQSWGYGKYARKSSKLMELAAAAAAQKKGLLADNAPLVTAEA